MKKTGVKVFAFILLGMALGVSAPADAKSRHHTTHRHTAHHHITHKKSKISAAKARIRQAQTYLNQLGYDAGRPDGIIGKGTRTALKAFQNDHGLFATGKLTDETYKLLAKETRGKKSMSGPHGFSTENLDYYGHVNQAYSDPNQYNSPQPIPSRYGNLQIVGEQAPNNARRYVMSLNGQEVFQAENQPSPVLLSQTFQLADTDLIVITSYNNGNITCGYKHYLLAVRANSNHLYEVQNCTRNFEAHTADGNLLITFPGDGGTGDMWRYENGLLVKL